MRYVEHEREDTMKATYFIYNKIVSALAAMIMLTACASAQTEDTRRIIAIGDLHGDFESYRALLVEAGLTNKRGRWRGGESILVQTGDVPDRGPDSRAIIENLRALKKQAQRKGGDVFALIGNHEAMNVTGDLRYVHPGEYEAFANRNSERLRDAVYEANRESIEAAYHERDPALTANEIRDAWMDLTPLGLIEHQQAWRPTGNIGEWITSNDAVMIIDKTLFAHGGLSEKYTSFSIADMNNKAREALAARSTDPESIINDAWGPLWYRGLVRRPEEAEPNPDTDTIADPQAIPSQTEPLEPLRLSIADEVSLVLDTYNIDRIVIGHTPSPTGIRATQDGRVIQIDTGISDYYGGTQSFLRIEDGIVYAHDNGAITIIDGDAQ